MDSKWLFAKHRGHEFGQVCTGCIVDDDQDLVIAEVYELEGVNNGPLMACAPEMLVALKNLVSLAKDWVADAEDWHEYQHAVAAIAKAEATNVR